MHVHPTNVNCQDMRIDSFGDRSWWCMVSGTAQWITSGILSSLEGNHPTHFRVRSRVLSQGPISNLWCNHESHHWPSPLALIRSCMKEISNSFYRSIDITQVTLEYPSRRCSRSDGGWHIIHPVLPNATTSMPTHLLY